MTMVLTGPVREFGADAYADWTAVVKRLGGTATVWPFKTGLYAGLYGRPAARFSKAGYVAASKARLLDFTTPTQPTANTEWLYVLAPASVAQAAPQTMTTLQRAENEFFTRTGQAADAIGLPSLRGIEDFVKSLGRDAAIIGGVIILAWWLLNRTTHRRD